MNEFYFALLFIPHSRQQPVQNLWGQLKSFFFFLNLHDENTRIRNTRSSHFKMFFFFCSSNIDFLSEKLQSFSHCQKTMYFLLHVQFGKACFFFFFSISNNNVPMS